MSFYLYPFHPEYYHGRDNSRPYFEGWYFRQTKTDGSFSIAIIPGISKGRINSKDHSFIQIIFGPKAESYYQIFPINYFKYKQNPFQMSIGENLFSQECLIININSTNLSLKADLSFEQLIPLKKSVFKPSIMGPFGFLPNMQCNHGILSLHHQVRGLITLNGQSIDLNIANGYIEKDWGREFPSSWLWIHGNHNYFHKGASSFTCSIASIPYRPISFTGLIAVFLFKEKEYRFTTYDGSKVRDLSFSGNSFSFYLKHHKYKLVVKGSLGASATLKAPVLDGMQRDIYEYTDGKLEAYLYHGNNIIAIETFEHAAIELTNTDKLLK